MKREGDYIMIDIHLISAMAWVVVGPVFGLAIFIATKLMH